MYPVKYLKGMLLTMRKDDYPNEAKVLHTFFLLSTIYSSPSVFLFFFLATRSKACRMLIP